MINTLMMFIGLVLIVAMFWEVAREFFENRNILAANILLGLWMIWAIITLYKLGIIL